MPTWDKILDECKSLNPHSLLKKYVAVLQEKTQRTVIGYMTAFTVIKPPVPSLFHSIIDQDMQGFMTCVKGTNEDSLDFVLHTPGGGF